MIGFEAGVPVALDGRHARPRRADRRARRLAGSYGFGRIDMVENRRVGIKSREIYEARQRSR